MARGIYGGGGVSYGGLSGRGTIGGALFPSGNYRIAGQRFDNIDDLQAALETAIEEIFNALVSAGIDAAASISRGFYILERAYRFLDDFLGLESGLPSWGIEWMNSIGVDDPERLITVMEDIEGRGG